MIKKVEGIIIRSQDYGEGSKILTLYTKELGKIGIMARGAKKTKSRFSAISQLFSHGYFVLFHNSGLGNLTSGDVVHAFRNLQLDIVKTAWAAYIVELVDKLTEEKKVDTHLFYLLFVALSLINDGKDPEIVSRIFELQLLQRIGVKPVLGPCVLCNQHHNTIVAFSVREGGVVCERCISSVPNTIILSQATVRLLHLLAGMDIEKLGKVEIKAQTRKQLAAVMRSFMDTYIGITIKSLSFLDQLSLLENTGDNNDAKLNKSEQ